MRDNAKVVINLEQGKEQAAQLQKLHQRHILIARSITPLVVGISHLEVRTNAKFTHTVDGGEKGLQASGCLLSVGS